MAGGARIARLPRRASAKRVAPVVFLQADVFGGQRAVEGLVVGGQRAAPPWRARPAPGCAAGSSSAAVTSAPAPTTEPAPITASSRMVACMPIRQPSSTRQACSIARWPTTQSRRRSRTGCRRRRGRPCRPGCWSARPTVTGAQVAAQHGAVPDRDVVAQAHVADHRGAREDQHVARRASGSVRQVAIDDRAREPPPQLLDPRVQRRRIGQRAVDDGDRRGDGRHAAVRLGAESAAAGAGAPAAGLVIG